MDIQIAQIPKVKPARGALITITQMGPSERTQGWLPKQPDHGMCLLDNPIKNIRTFQTRVVLLAMGAEMRAAHGLPNDTPGRDNGFSSRKAAADEYAATPERARESSYLSQKGYTWDCPT